MAPNKLFYKKVIRVSKKAKFIADFESIDKNAKNPQKFFP